MPESKNPPINPFWELTWELKQSAELALRLKCDRVTFQRYAMEAYDRQLRLVIPTLVSEISKLTPRSKVTALKMANITLATFYAANPDYPEKFELAIEHGVIKAVPITSPRLFVCTKCRCIRKYCECQ